VLLALLQDAAAKPQGTCCQAQQLHSHRLRLILDSQVLPALVVQGVAAGQASTGQPLVSWHNL
jgi:hypothetical protein